MIPESTTLNDRKVTQKLWHRRVTLVITIAALGLMYVLARHLAADVPHVSGRLSFSLYVDPAEKNRNRPVIVIEEGAVVHIDVQTKEAGVLMVHEIPGAIATCSPGKKQSLDILPVGVTGRFSLHFHTQSGEQIEVATIEIYPKA